MICECINYALVCPIDTQAPQYSLCEVCLNASTRSEKILSHNMMFWNYIR
jgi:hypothetical protein